MKHRKATIVLAEELLYAACARHGAGPDTLLVPHPPLLPRWVWADAVLPDAVVEAARARGHDRLLLYEGWRR